MKILRLTKLGCLRICARFDEDIPFSQTIRGIHLQQLNRYPPLRGDGLDAVAYMLEVFFPTVSARTKQRHYTVVKWVK